MKGGTEIGSLKGRGEIIEGFDLLSSGGGGGMSGRKK